MVISQFRARQKQTGAKYTAFRKKRKSDMGRLPTMTKLGATKQKQVRTMGGNGKLRLLTGDTLNLYDPTTKKSAKVKVKNVVESPANRHYVRRNVMTKGTIVETEQGKARITSRPGQDGTLNAVLVK